MDLLLAHAYYLAEDPHERAIMRPYPPLGLLYLASHLKARGVEVEVFDSTFADRAAFRQRLAEGRPPVVGIYGNLITRANVVAMSREAKAAGATVVLGGPEPASYAEEYLRRGADVVVHGEGELALEEILSSLGSAGPADLTEVPGLSLLVDGELVHTGPRPLIKDLDAQPWPDRSAIDLGRYLEVWREHHGQGPVSLITARGCPYKCQWCSHGVFGYSHRRRSPSGVADEVASIVAELGADALWYADDVFTMNKRWLGQYASELAARGLRLPFETITREDRLDEEVVGLLAEMGCHRLWIGAESGSQRILDAMQRRTSAERTRAMIRLVQSHGIEAGTFIMLGYEGETVADLEETVAHLKGALPDRFLTTVSYPIKGTPYYESIADRIVASAAWETSTDRDLQIVGRPGPRFYEHAIRWMVSEVELHRLRAQGTGSLARRARLWANGRLGRLGMRFAAAPVGRGP